MSFLRNNQFNESFLIRFADYIPGIKGISQAVSTTAMATKSIFLIINAPIVKGIDKVLLYKIFNLLNLPCCDWKASNISKQFALNSIHISN